MIKTGKIKLTALMLLAALMLLTACAGKPAARTEDAAGPESGDTQTAEPDILDGLDFKGADYRINMSATDISSHVYMESLGESTGDVALDSVYERNLAVQEKLNVNFVYTETDFGWSSVTNEVRKIVLSGEDAFELIVNDEIGLAAAGVEKLLVNVYECEYFDFKKPGWWHDYMRDLTIGNDKMYLLVGDYFIDVLRKSHVIYFNRAMFRELYGNPDDLYAAVIGGSWTYDEFLKHIIGAYSDTDGSGSKSRADTFGLIIGGVGGSIFPFSYGTDAPFVTRDAQGVPSLTMNNERSNKLYEKIYAAFYNDATDCGNYYTEPSALHAKFIGDGSLFISGAGIGDFDIFRSMESDIGLLPYPKLDETQSSYVTVVHDTAEIGVIPITCTNTAMASAVVQALCQESAKTVVPAYYETALKVKYVRDNYSAQMIDLVHDGISGLFTLVYGAAHVNNIFTWAFLEPLQAKSESWISSYAKRESAAIEGLDKLIEAYLN